SPPPLFLIRSRVPESSLPTDDTSEFVPPHGRLRPRRPSPAAFPSLHFRVRPGLGSYGAPPVAAPGGGEGSLLYLRVGRPSHGGGGADAASPPAAPCHHGPGPVFYSGSSAPILWKHQSSSPELWGAFDYLLCP
ncbi:unnamed protein product, partial [Urochloa humidicola]